jgi:hypothetical protein
MNFACIRQAYATQKKGLLGGMSDLILRPESEITTTPWLGVGSLACYEPLIQQWIVQ